ncbi:Protein CBG19988 [Caenorhabditis briggsae]|uniref:DNA-directed DNA polymerase n=1 Tax=Caenorhabditis briggsae TaxID=6238 RepID=A8XWV8_CAEBR|nr:Protein CBG19988 [Caenorhabditis briggsae]CAP37127.2 Protein CBG19988 [Caenorhabditis briggsae]
MFFIYSFRWLKNVCFDEEWKVFLEEYEEKEVITLDPDRFETNAIKKAVAKLMINSLWGKLSQRVDKQNTVIVLDPAKFWKVNHDTSLVIVDVRPVNDKLFVKYRQKEETLSSQKTSAVHLAAYTTAFARLSPSWRWSDLEIPVIQENEFFDVSFVFWYSDTFESVPDSMKNRKGTFCGKESQTWMN